MRQNFNPREYQRTMIDFIIDNPRCAVFAGMGMGKTCGTLTALDILELTEPGPGAGAHLHGHRPQAAPGRLACRPQG